MPKATSRDLAVGSVFALALCIAALALMAVGGEVPGLTKSRVTYHVFFPNAEGLLLGAPVRMAGVDIGAVAEIRLPKDPTVVGIEVQLAIQEDYAARVRADSQAGLRILQLLTNEKYVEVSAGSPDQEQLPPGAQLPIAPGSEFLQQGEAIAENLVEITAVLRHILEPVDRGEGLLGRMLQDPEFGAAGVEALGESLENMRQLTDDMLAGRGVAGRLLYDEALARKLDTLGVAIDRLSEIVTTIDRGDGLLGDLLTEGGSGEQAVEELRAAAASFRRLIERLEAGDSVLGDLMRAQTCPTSPSRNICDTLENLAQVSQKLDRGEGTLGALINERGLYDGAEDLMVGTNDSKFVRWLLRRYRKQGIENEQPVAQPVAPAAGAPEGSD